MANQHSNAPMHELFVFETTQLLEQLECLILDSEKSGCLEDSINEVFRVMHTIKGSAAMMLFNEISSLAHLVEDVFFYLREVKPQEVNYSELTDLVLKVIDYIKIEADKIRKGEEPDGDSTSIKNNIKAFLDVLKGKGSDLDNECKTIKNEDSQYKYYINARKFSVDTEKNVYEACIFFDEDCGMENMRAFTLVHELKQFAEDIKHEPPDILENSETAEIIRKEGFRIILTTKNSLETIQDIFAKTLFLKDFKIHIMDADTQIETEGKRRIDLDGPIPSAVAVRQNTGTENGLLPGGNVKQNLISVHVSKMDLLMDLVGELVIAEAMVTQNPELEGLTLDKFHKATRQLRKITNELQDIVMSVRMIELTPTFQKMKRIVRDMTKQLNKQAELEILGEETEVDKNIIEQLSDPLMHLIRNALDHGIESVQVRQAKGKPATGKIRLEAKNAGGEVLIIIQDDGGGLNKEKIFTKAKERGLVQEEDMDTLTDKEIFSFIMQPGFSTKEEVSEFSGRGVGMDVVAKNLEKIGGKVSVDSIEGEGTTITIKIPLTLAIIDGMNIKVGNSVYTIPTITIKESFQSKDHKVIKDTDDNEMVMIRGECYPIIRLSDRFGAKTVVTNLDEGIMVMVEDDGKGVCLFADVLLGQQPVVVKALPQYIKQTKGIAGCTLLGDGSVSLILDIAGLVHF